jgi:hypothetical protein
MDTTPRVRDEDEDDAIPRSSFASVTKVAAVYLDFRRRVDMPVRSGDLTPSLCG